MTKLAEYSWTIRTLLQRPAASMEPSEFSSCMAEASEIHRNPTTFDSGCSSHLHMVQRPVSKHELQWQEGALKELDEEVVSDRNWSHSTGRKLKVATLSFHFWHITIIPYTSSIQSNWVWHPWGPCIDYHLFCKIQDLEVLCCLALLRGKFCAHFYAPKRYICHMRSWRYPHCKKRSK